MTDTPRWLKMLQYGLIIKTNSFDTVKGCYTIRIIQYKGNLYFHKMLNGSVVEIVNLSTHRPEKQN